MGTCLAIASKRDEKPCGVRQIPGCAQNMMLAAWNEGVASAPNGSRDAAAAEAVGLEEGELKTILSFVSYPARPRAPESRPAEEWSARANRKPLTALVTRL